MRERTVWVTGYVPRQEPKLNFPYAVAEIPLPVREVDGPDLVRVGSVTPAQERWDNVGRIGLFEHCGKLWRPMIVTGWQNHEAPEATEVIAKAPMDNPVLAVATRHRKQFADLRRGVKDGDGLSPHVDVRHADHAALGALRADLNSAARNVLICEGVPYRTCHEPTWIVAPARRMPASVVVQPFLSAPGGSGEAAWFGFSRRDDAVAFGEQRARELGGACAVRGEIDLSPGFEWSFDGVAFAEARMAACFGRGAMPLAGILPEQAFSMARAVAAGEGGVAEALLVAEAAEAMAGRPDVDALLLAGEAALSQVRYFQASAVFSDEDEQALGSLSFR